jgi:hypothetical protein
MEIIARRRRLLHLTLICAFPAVLLIAAAADAAQALTVVRFASDRSFPVAEGTPITWTANVIGGAGLFEYKFWRYDVQKRQWTLVQDYSRGDQYSWTPTSLDVGQYHIQVWIREVGSTASYETFAQTDDFLIVDAPATVPVVVDRVEKNVGAVAAAGTPVRWTAWAHGGSGLLEYRFWRRDPSGWTIARDYSANPVYDWLPVASDRGAHLVQVWVRQRGSAQPYEAWANDEGLEVVWGTSGLTVDLEREANAGPQSSLIVDGVRLTAAGVSADGTVPTLMIESFDGLAADPQAYDFVRGQVVRVSGDRLRIDLPNSSAVVGFGLALSATAAPSLVMVTFLDADGVPMLNTSTTVDRTQLSTYGGRYSNAEGHFASVVPIGARSIEIENLGEGSTRASKYNWVLDNLSFDRDPTPITVRLEMSGAYSGPSGLSIGQGVNYFHAHAKGGGAIEYQFWRRTPSGWSLARDYGADPNFTWIATADQLGECALEVWARNVGSSVAYEATGQAVFRVSNSPAIEPKLNVSPLANQFSSLSGFATTFTANVLLAGAEYSFWRRDGTTWVLVEPYSYRSSYRWTPTAADVGIPHDVEVRVRQRGSGVAYLLWRDVGEFQVVR